jgi:ankyrin repeat protein
LPTARLPDNPSFEHLRNQAKILQRFVRAGVPEALEMVREFHPRLGDISANTPAAAGFSRAAAQLITARRYGFPSWARLRAYVEVVARYSRAPHRVVEAGTQAAGQAPTGRSPAGQAAPDQALAGQALAGRATAGRAAPDQAAPDQAAPDQGPADQATDLALADEFVLLACLTHGGDDPDHPRRAAELLAARPALTRASVYAAAVAGDVAAMRDWLDRDKTAANREGGPHGWEPILYLAYSAVKGSHLETARLLLDAGADPAAGYLWEGLSPPYTALTGALTSGHSQPIELARLLLERGANANDSQLLYEISGTDDTDAHELLYEFGLGTGDGGVWRARLAPNHPSPAELAQEELIKAAASNHPRRARLILRHPVDLAGLGDRHPIHEGRTAWQLAMIHGHTEVIALLRAAGAEPARDPELEFLSACMRADRAEVARLRAAAPGLLARAIARRPSHLSTAADEDRFDAVMLMTELGFDPNATFGPHRQAALHGAAFRGNLAMVKYLVGHGADPGVEDCSFHATALGWAEHHHHEAVADYLASLPG